MNAEVEQILKDKTSTQVEWVLARAVLATDEEASLSVGVHPKTPYKHWPLSELKRAVELIRHEQAMRSIEAVCYQMPEAIRKTQQQLQEVVLAAQSELVPLALEATKKKLKARQVPISVIHMVLDPYLNFTRETDDASKIIIEYVNNWRQNPLTESASWPEDSEESGETFQLAECGSEMAKNDNGNVHRG